MMTQIILLLAKTENTNVQLNAKEVTYSKNVDPSYSYDLIQVRNTNY